MDNIAVHFATQCLYIVLILSLPAILVASIVGLLLSLVQAVTQLQEQTLIFGVKLLCVILTFFILGGWISAELLSFSREVFIQFSTI